MVDDAVLVERVFTVDVSAAQAWAALADLRHWPVWAPHIRAVTVTPSSALGPDSRGRFRFRPVGSAEFVMRSWDPPRSWTWTGRALGVRIGYIHAFEPIAADRSRLCWRVELDDGRPGPRARLFAAIYARQIDRAWPRFRDWVATHRTP